MLYSTIHLSYIINIFGIIDLFISITQSVNQAQFWNIISYCFYLQLLLMCLLFVQQQLWFLSQVYINHCNHINLAFRYFKFNLTIGITCSTCVIIYSNASVSLKFGWLILDKSYFLFFHFCLLLILANQ